MAVFNKDGFVSIKSILEFEPIPTNHQPGPVESVYLRSCNLQLSDSR